MEAQTIQETEQRARNTTASSFCTHQRLIDDILTKGGKRTGKVRCLECMAIFDDPYKGLK